MKYGISKQWYFFISPIDYSIDKTSDLHVKGLRHRLPFML